MKPLVIYHANCQDGFTAAWIIWKKHPDWEFFPAKHGNPPPDVSGRDVYLVDFSYKYPVLVGMCTNSTPNVKSITILDHHKTAQEDLINFEGPQAFDPDETVKRKVVFDMNKSGAMLTWEYFNSKEKAPKLIYTVQDRDLWKFECQYTKPLSEYIFSKEYSFEEWDKLVAEFEDPSTLQDAVDKGQAILDKHLKDVKELSANKFRMNIGGHEVWVCNVPYMMASDMGHLLSESEPFAGTFYYDGKHFQFSLRSHEDGLDVSEIAKQYGGGGHKHAAGFRAEPKASIMSNIYK